MNPLGHVYMYACMHIPLTSSVFKEYLVVESQSQFGHPREVDVHFDTPNNLALQDLSIGTDLYKGGHLKVKVCIYI